MVKRTIKDTLPQYVLPSDNVSLQNFSRRHKLKMMEHVVTSIEFAVKHELPMIEVFQFRDSDFVITVSAKDFISNLDNIYSFFIQNESYEKCPTVVKLQQTLKGTVFNITNEKQTYRINRGEGQESRDTST